MADGTPPRNLQALLPPHWREEIVQWIQQDMPKWDVGGLVVGEAESHAMLLGKSKGVLAGLPFATHVFEYLGLKVEWLREEGHVITAEEAAAKTPVAKVSGPTRNILMAERTALNILSRASGVATAAHAAMSIAREHGWKGRVAGTRKTTPGFGIVEKYSLLVGGADTHRMDLSNMVMLKDNHIWSTGSISESVSRARFACGFSTKIEVECTSEQDAREACEAGADIVMLDNYSGEQLREVASRIKSKWPHVIIEASGGITMETMHLFFAPSVDIISQGALTNGYSTLDFSLKVPKPATFQARSRADGEPPEKRRCT
uniref:Nicotinate-nucleotide pyrophosphorylase [carboxylating] n=1 Tax=Haptolina brevifila TaxID=156173 RepID=A0A7S2CYV5_9EUKA|mmetsp:Transcript_30254/g.60750  ORF Transcript_30254/g.60750 Transcript_30254/m.60750 type:complete len:317 (+) Transcript_30254:82-1032(+)